MEQKTIEELIYEETEMRLEAMQSKDYEFPKEAKMADAVGIVLSIVCSLVLIILCMLGVIV